MSILTPLAASMTSALFAAIWQSLLLSTVVALCLRLVPTLSASARSIVWRTVAVLAFLLFFAQVNSTHVVVGASSLPRVLSINPRWSLLVAVLWIAASLTRAIQLGIGAVALRGLARAATPIAPPDKACAALLAQSRRRESRPAQLCISTEVDRPSVLGFFRPRVLLPASLLATLSPAALEQVLLHELEHLRRRDDWANLLGRIALVVFPLNPILLWLERRLATERELACDERVLEATGARKAYALCLAHIAEHTLVQRGLTLALGLIGVRSWPRRSELAHRVDRILTLPARTLRPRTSAALVTLVVAVATGGSIELAHSPRLVQFTSPGTSAPLTAGTHLGGHLLPATYTRRSASPFVETRAVVTRHAEGLRFTPAFLKTAAPQASTRAAFHPDVRRRALPTRPFVPARPFVRLTSFHTRPSNTSVQLTFIVANPNQFSYAAVPVRGGWVLVLLPAQPTLTLNL